MITLCAPFRSADSCCWDVIKYLTKMSPQVYEHVYETVDINSSPEVRANATAKVDPSQIPSNTQAFDLCSPFSRAIHFNKGLTPPLVNL